MHQIICHAHIDLGDWFSIAYNQHGPCAYNLVYMLSKSLDPTMQLLYMCACAYLHKANHTQLAMYMFHALLWLLKS